jgi:adenosylcobinamide-GDP ribazoletransferase
VSRGVTADAWRLAVGTLTAVPISPPSRVDPAVARRSILLAPIAALPLGAVAAGVGAATLWFGLPAVASGLLVVAAVAVLNRGLHLDGLSDTVDGLAASYDRERSLAVMKSGTAGPAGVAATVVVVGIQASAVGALLSWWGGVLLVGVAVAASRAALLLGCLTLFPPARADGLGKGLTQAIRGWEAAAAWLVVGALLTATAVVVGHPWWRGAVAVLLVVVVVLAGLRRVSRRLGGVTGDVFGAAIEVAAATLLLALA